MKFLTFAASVVALAAGLGSTANAADYIFQWDYIAPLSLHGITYENTVLIQDADVSPQYTGSYGLWNGQSILSDFTANFNIFDGNGNLIHTYAVAGTTGSGGFSVPFLSSAVAPLALLAGGTSVVATGAFQTVYAFSTADDNYTLQFRSNLGGAVPEPASWAMLIAGFGLTGAAMRRRNAVAGRAAG